MPIDNIDIIRKKIDNREFPLSNQEIEILKESPELTKKIALLLSEDLSMWKSENENLLMDEIVEYLVDEISDKFWLNYTLYHMTEDKNFFTEFDMDVIDGVAALSVEGRQKIEDVISNYIKTNNFTNQEIYFNKNTLDLLLEYERYDLISRLINGDTGLPDETIERIISNFPFDKYESPYFLGLYIDKFLDKLDLLSDKSLCCYFSSLEHHSSSEKLRNLNIPFQILVDKFSSKKFNPPEYIFNFNLETADSYKNITKEQLRELCNAGVLNALNVALEKEAVTEEEAEKICLEYLNNTEDKRLEFTKYSSFVKLVGKREALADAMIENGFIYQFVEFGLLKKWPEKKQKCIEHISKSRKREFPILQITSEVLESQDVIVELVKQGYIKSVDSNTFGVSYHLKSNQYEFIKKIAQTCPDVKFNTLHTITDNPDSQFELAKIFINNKSFDNLITLFTHDFWSNNQNFSMFFKENQDILTSIILNDSNFARSLLERKASIIINNKELISLYSQRNYLIESLLNYVDHHENFHTFYNQENFDLLAPILAKINNVDEQRLKRLEQLVGPKIIRFISSENIQQLLHMDEENFHKIVELFPKVEFTMDDLQSAYDSLKQYGYAKNNPQVISAFPNILHAIEDKNEEVIKQYIEEIPKYLDERFFNKFEENYVTPEGYDRTNPTLFVVFVIEKIKNSQADKRDKYIDILHEITNYYINAKRCEYRESYDIKEELDVPYNLNQKSVEREVNKRYINESSYHTVFNIKHPITNEVTKMLIKDYMILKLSTFNIDQSFAEELVYYHSRERHRKTYTYPEEVLQNNYKLLIKAMNLLKKENPNMHFQTPVREQYLDMEGLIKREYHPGENATELINIITTLNIKALTENVLANEEVYKVLKNMMQKRKLHAIPKCLMNLLSEKGINISDDMSNIASFISYFSSIYEKEISRLEAMNMSSENFNMNFTNILINAEAYSCISSVYSQVLGDEDSRLIKSNPGPNSASSKLANNGRLKEAVKLTEILYKKQAVTIPTFNEVINLDSNKKMRAIVGNFTSPCNLTHGERTGACMRIGGVGETLFNFVINNENGFHIRFENPETGKYVSRVTGFRNGNTVFLNELRNSCDTTYNDKDVVDACTKVAEALIELSKNSTCPIENVVVHRAYATSYMEKPNTLLDVKNIKEGLPYFYSDVNNNAIVLATTATDKQFTKVNFNKSNVPRYQPAREIPVVSKDLQIMSKIIRVDTIKRMLAGENYEYISPLTFPDGLIYAIVSNDWYIYIDRNGEIHKDVMDIDPRAKEELAEYLIKLETELNIDELKEASYGI